jgi:hypothetical protein
MARDHEELEHVTTAASNESMSSASASRRAQIPPRAKLDIPMGNDDASDVTTSAIGPNVRRDVSGSHS